MVNRNSQPTARLSKLNSSDSKLNEQLLRTRSGRCIKQNSDFLDKCAAKRERNNLISRIKRILDKSESDRDKSEIDLLENSKDIVSHIDLCKANRLLNELHQQIVIDDEQVLKQKCSQLAQAIKHSKSCVIYTGAGISTAASIPDYRGPNGLWTMCEKGIQLKPPDFALVKPTFSHMALKKLIDMKLVSHVVSQNCDGLHLRSGIDRNDLSELHGNCFIEFCTSCCEEYVRDFDVTERSTFRKHSTGRFCKNCRKTSECKSHDQNDCAIDLDESSMRKCELRDSIIHFGEKLRNGLPYNWEEARTKIKNADTIICLGTSLKVLKHYACLWPKSTRYSLYIVNIQWTSKDKQAKLKINGYCDEVLRLVMAELQNSNEELRVNDYSYENDQILKLAVDLEQYELSSTSKNFLKAVSLGKSNSFQVDSNIQLPVSTNEKEFSVSNESVTLNSWFIRSFKNKKRPVSKTVDSKKNQ